MSAISWISPHSSVLGQDPSGSPKHEGESNLPNNELMLGELGQSLEIKLPRQLEGSVGELKLSLVNKTGKDLSSLSIGAQCSCLRSSLVREAAIEAGATAPLLFTVYATKGGFRQTAKLSGLTKGTDVRIDIAEIIIEMECDPPIKADSAFIFLGAKGGARVLLKPQFEKINIYADKIELEEQDGIELRTKRQASGDIELVFVGKVPVSREMLFVNIPFSAAQTEAVPVYRLELTSMPKMELQLSPSVIEFKLRNDVYVGRAIVTENFVPSDQAVQDRLSVAVKFVDDDVPMPATLRVLRELESTTIVEMLLPRKIRRGRNTEFAVTVTLRLQDGSSLTGRAFGSLGD